MSFRQYNFCYYNVIYACYYNFTFYISIVVFTIKIRFAIVVVFHQMHCFRIKHIN